MLRCGVAVRALATRQPRARRHSARVMATAPQAPLASQRTRRSAHVAVVGAGAAGLAAARELRAEGHVVRVYEAGADVGGTWRYDAGASAHSSMYASLRTNLPRELMAFSDLAFDASAPLTGDARRYCGHAEVLAYLVAFADTHALRPLIRFGVRVERARPLWTSVTPALGPQWEVTTSGSSTPHVFDALVVANGHYAVPRTPAVDGLSRFPGVVAHTHDYCTPAPFAGKRVVVVGAAASGEDISRDIAPVAAAVFLSAASFQTDGPLTGGAVQKRAMLVRLGADGVAEFADGAREHVDAVLFATGYHFSFPFLGARVLDVQHAAVAVAGSPALPGTSFPVTHRDGPRDGGRQLCCASVRAPLPAGRAVALLHRPVLEGVCRKLRMAAVAGF
jgi:hypothetical protein